MAYQIRKARKSDLPRIEEIYAGARRFMAEHGNPGQWGNQYPPREMLIRDITETTLHVIEDTEGIHGVFYYYIGEDPAYSVIYNGSWRSDSRYGTIHRIAGDGSGGILRSAVEFAKGQIAHLRIDTHENNAVMQGALEKLGFRRCGIIYLKDGTSRIAYDHTETVREAREEDLQEILELYLHLHETQLPEVNDALRNTWDQILGDENHHLIVCEVDGKIISSCVCVVIPNLTRNVRPYAFVENVVTHKDYRGRGYATACLKKAKKIAQDSGCYKMMLQTGSKEESTLAFYRNSGYNDSDKTAFIQWLT